MAFGVECPTQRGNARQEGWPMFISCEPPRVLPTFTMAATSRTASVGVNIELGNTWQDVPIRRQQMANGQIDPRQQHDLQPFELGAIPILRTTLDLLWTILGTYKATENKVAHVICSRVLFSRGQRPSGLR